MTEAARIIKSIANRKPDAPVQSVAVFTYGSPRSGEDIWIQAMLRDGTEETIWEGRLGSLFDSSRPDPMGDRIRERRSVIRMARHYLHRSE